MQHTVYAVAHEHLLFHLLDMNIGSALNDGVTKKRIDDTHDRQVLCHFLEIIS